MDTKGDDPRTESLHEFDSIEKNICWKVVSLWRWNYDGNTVGLARRVIIFIVILTRSELSTWGLSVDGW